jgi:hypothetical protein
MVRSTSQARSASSRVPLSTAATRRMLSARLASSAATRAASASARVRASVARVRASLP